MKSYKVEIDKKDLNLISGLDIKNLIVGDEKITFVTDKKTLNILKNNFDNVYFVNILFSRMKEVVSKHFVTLIGAFAFAFVMIFISKTITEITFVDSNTYDYEVENYVISRMKKVGPFSFLNDDLNDIDKDLKKKFYHYEWIGISKKGTTLLIEISPSFLNPDDDNRNDKIPGYLYAKKDAIIKKYHVEKGIVLIQEEQYVKKGDLLISGDILHYDQSIERIHPKGYVIGEVLEYYEYTIPKIKNDNVRNGKVSYQDYFFYKDKMIGKDKNTDNDYEETVVKNFFDLFYIKRRYYYERENTKTVLSYDEANNYAKTLIYKKFLANKTNKLEKIIYIKLARSSEDENNYYFRFVVKSEESIEEFLTN